MPFTFAHPAAAVTFIKLRLPLSALVVGSMAPDLPYFIHFSTSHQYGHTLPGIFLFCLPVGLIALLLFHSVLKLPLLSLLPAIHQMRLIPVANTFRFGPSHQFWLIIWALLLGAFTHIVWDSFTHADGWTVQHISLLCSPVIQTSHGTLYVFKILQHGSTLLGAVLLAHWYFSWFRQTLAQPVELPIQLPEAMKLHLVLLIILLALVLAGVYGYSVASSFVGAGQIQLFARNLVVVGSAVMVIELFVFSGIWHFKASRRGLGR